jgi:hypothetical protein
MNKTIVGFALLAATIAVWPATANAQDDKLQAAIDRCMSGTTWYCIEAASGYRKLEDPEMPTKTLEYAKLACDKGSSFGCRLESMVAYDAGIKLHKRIINTRIDGDPKGEWKYKSDLNAAIERARSYYQRAEAVDSSLNDDWAGSYASLDRLRQD